MLNWPISGSFNATVVKPAVLLALPLVLTLCLSMEVIHLRNGLFVVFRSKMMVKVMSLSSYCLFCSCGPPKTMPLFCRVQRRRAKNNHVVGGSGIVWFPLPDDSENRQPEERLLPFFCVVVLNAAAQETELYKRVNTKLHQALNKLLEIHRHWLLRLVFVCHVPSQTASWCQGRQSASRQMCMSVPSTPS